MATLIPTIIIDTREQRPYHWGADQPTHRVALASGDYSVQGYESRLTVERKTLDDFTGTLMKAGERFHAELSRMANMDAAVIVVEAMPMDVHQHLYKGGAAPASILGMSIQIQLDHGVPIYWMGSRAVACDWTRRYLLAAVKSLSAPRKDQGENES